MIETEQLKAVRDSTSRDGIVRDVTVFCPSCNQHERRQHQLEVALRAPLFVARTPLLSLHARLCSLCSAADDAHALHDACCLTCARVEYGECARPCCRDRADCAASCHDSAALQTRLWNSEISRERPRRNCKLHSPRETGRAAQIAAYGMTTAQ